MSRMVKTPPGKPIGQPAVWNLPQRRNIHFTGRQQVLRDIEQGLSHSHPAPQILAGGGGCGKTALAVEYAYVHRDWYDIVWWIRAETPSTITADLASLAGKFATSGQMFDTPRQACNAVLHQLRKRKRWLLIFDNARDPEDLRGFLPPHTPGHVLITSANPHWQSAGKLQPVDSWTRGESIAFLDARLGGISEAHAARQLAAALGDLPLAMEQAAACIEQADLSIGEYLRDYENLWAEMLGRGKAMGAYPAHVAMTWELSLRRIESLNPTAAQLLTLCGFFSPDHIPLSMLETAAAELPAELGFSVSHGSAQAEMLNLFERFSMAKTGEDSLSIHGVIAAMAQDRLDPVERGKWAAIAMRIASASFAFDSQNPQSWQACASALPHAMVTTLHARNAGVAAGDVVDMLSRIGRFLLKQGNYGEARSLLEMAHEVVAKTHGARSPVAADIANNLARVRHRLGDLAGASALYDVALKIDRANYGDDDPHLATVANNSAMTLVELGRLGEARERFEWAIGVYRKSYVKDNPKIASVMNNLGFVLLQMKDYANARHWLEQALAISESNFGANHPQVACVAVNLGGALRAQHNHAAAQTLFERAMKIDQAAFGNHHPAIARDLLNLAQLLSDRERYDEAVPLLERALDITETSFGPEHRETVLCLKELGRALKGAGDTGRAVDCMMRVSRIMAKSTGRPANETIVGDEGMLA